MHNTRYKTKTEASSLKLNVRTDANLQNFPSHTQDCQPTSAESIRYGTQSYRYRGTSPIRCYAVNRSARSSPVSRACRAEPNL